MSFRSSRPRTAFTLIELLVVIAIIAILIALLVPAVQKVREAAARTQCQNNIKQLVLAIHNYHDSFGYYPYSDPTISYSGGSNGWSWLARTLPYIEQDGLFKQLDMSKSLLDTTSNNRNLVKTSIKSLLCPSDPTDGVRSDLQSYWAWPAANSASGDAGITCYMGYQGDWFPADDTTPPDGVFERSMNPNKKIKVATVTDGLSNTLFIGERSPTYSPWAAWAAGNGCWIVDRYAINHIRILYPVPAAHAVSDAYGASSLHTGGINTGFGDGSVHFLADSMNFTTYKQLDRFGDGGPLSWSPTN